MSDKLPFKGGTPTILWNKVMKEVAENRYAGPFEQIPFENYIQSPIGLVPKSGNKTRLIFHLSYNFGKEDEPECKSFNYHMPYNLCSVHYNDIDHAVARCLKMIEDFKNRGFSPRTIYFGKSDLSNAFRIVPGKINQRKWLTLKAMHPLTKRVYYFVDLCMPFGASISCAIFQAFSNALAHIMEWLLKTNY